MISDELILGITYFKNELVQGYPFGGQVQLNPIPEVVKKMIKQDGNVILKMRTEMDFLDKDRRIWCYPKFKPTSNATVMGF